MDDFQANSAIEDYRPLAAIGGALHILAGTARDSQRAEATATATRCVAVMAAMIQDLLEYTRRQLGKGIPIAPAQANLGEVCNAALKEAALVLELPPGTVKSRTYHALERLRAAYAAEERR